MFGQDTGMVEAIEDGRIVRVTEEYARRERLLIIRKNEKSLDSPKAQQEIKLTPRLRGERKAFFDIEKYRRPWKDKNEILDSLVDNFHWIASSKRKQLNLSRKQLADAISVSEEDLKVFENGGLPKNDYVLISKLENYLKINLRNNKAPDTASGFTARKQSVHKPKWTDRIGASKPGMGAEELVASDTEIIDDSVEEDK